MFLTSGQDCNSGMQKRIHFRTDMEHNICRLVNNSDVLYLTLYIIYKTKVMFLQNWYPRETSLVFTGRQIIIVHPWDVAFPRAKAFGKTTPLG